MTPERWQRVKDLFLEATALEADARRTFLSDACAGDPELRGELDSLLEGHAAREAFVDRQAADYLPATDEVPQGDHRLGMRLGPYELLERIGSGGMGEVYRARRADAQFEKQVAIKLVRAGLDTRFVLGRFRAERQILASLEHPGIARLIDGGMTPEGLPYLVMELVDGEPIDRYCERLGLTIPDRLKLFRTVCDAVSYAHQRLVVHRDLKPSNILVTPRGAVKLLDFGIAKLVQPGTPESVDPTLTSLSALTPAFASPEQIKGLPVTTTSDVYSLGVVLFHLLTGRGPYRSAIESGRETLREVCDADPQRPSAVASRSPAAERRPRVPHELDDIVLRALRKEPDRRYGSIEQLSADIERYLTGQPVLAHGGRFSYHAGKFIRRHRLELSAAAAIATALIAGVVVATHEAGVARQQRARAERDFSRTRALANSLLFEVHDAIKDLPGSTPARHLLVERASQYLDELAAESSGDDRLLTELAVAYRKLGDIQGAYGGQSAGNAPAALASYRKSAEALEALHARHMRDPALASELAQTLTALATGQYMTGDLKSAPVTVRRAVALASEAQTQDPQNSLRLHELGTADSYACALLDAAGDFAGAAEVCRRTIAVQERLVAARPQDRRELRALAVAYDRTANNIDHTIAQTGHGRERLPEAQSLRRKALSLDQALADADPNNELAKRDVFADTVNLAETLTIANEPRLALDAFSRALTLINGLIERDPTNADLKIFAVTVRRDLCEVHVMLGQAALALTEVDAARAILEHLPPEQQNLTVEQERAAVELESGHAHLLAASADHPGREISLRESDAAVRAFTTSLRLYGALQARGALSAPYVSDVKEATDGLAASRAALEKLQRTGF